MRNFLMIYIYPNIQAIINRSDGCGYFQIVLLIEGKKYRYGFSLGEKEIATEWLFGFDEKNESYHYFIREGKVIKINDACFSEGLNTPYTTNLRNNTLFLTFCSAYNGLLSGKIRDFISHKIKHSEPSSPNEDRNSDTNKFVNENKKKVVLELAKRSRFTL